MQRTHRNRSPWSGTGDPIETRDTVPGLETQMLGHVAGDKFDAVVAAEDAYGVSDPGLVHVIARAQL